MVDLALVSVLGIVYWDGRINQGSFSGLEKYSLQSLASYDNLARYLLSSENLLKKNRLTNKFIRKTTDDVEQTFIF